MKTLASALIATLALTACGSSGGSNKSNGGDVVQADVKPVTTRAECYSSRTPTSLSGTWESEFSGGGLNIHVEFSFNGSTLSVSNTCEMNGDRATAYVSVPYQSRNSTIYALASANDEQSSGGLNCYASIDSSKSLPYHFDGGCLVFTDPKIGSFYLRPSY
jgi:hypothetical protein